MSKRYTHFRADLADTAALAAASATNPEAYPVGAEIVTADGARNVVTANDGTTITWGLVTVV